MCHGTNCPLKYKCHRHTAPVNPHRQSFFTEIPYDHDKKECPDFWDNSGRTKQEKKDE